MIWHACFFLGGGIMRLLACCAPARACGSESYASVKTCEVMRNELGK